MRTEERVKELGEVFTPPELIQEMIEKIGMESFDKDKTILDPTCGNGNILVEVLKYKISLHGTEHIIEMVKTLYGVDIMEDNVKETKERLKDIVAKYTNENIDTILDNNILCKDGLQYDYSFGERKRNKFRKK